MLAPANIFGLLVRQYDFPFHAVGKFDFINNSIQKRRISLTTKVITPVSCSNYSAFISTTRFNIYPLCLNGCKPFFPCSINPKSWRCRSTISSPWQITAAATFTIHSSTTRENQSEDILRKTEWTIPWFCLPIPICRYRGSPQSSDTIRKTVLPVTFRINSASLPQAGANATVPNRPTIKIFFHDGIQNLFRVLEQT